MPASQQLLLSTAWQTFAAARQMASVAIKYPRPPGEEQSVVDGHAPGYGVRVGVIARDDADEAWRVAHERFPEDRKGQITVVTEFLAAKLASRLMTLVQLGSK